MNTPSLIDKLRRRIRDDRHAHKAIIVNISEPTVSRAIAEVTQGRLIVTVQGGVGVTSVDIDLSSPLYSTVGSLFQHLARMKGYSVSLDEDAQEGHLSADIGDIPPTDIGPGRSGITLCHHLFSDIELQDILDDAISRHSPGMTVATVPAAEEVFVLQLAHAEVCRRQAYDAGKRRGLAETVSDLLDIARNIELSYQRDVARNSKAIESPREAAPNTTGSGDLVVGTMYRSSLRTGRNAPRAASLYPTQAILLDPTSDADLEDDNITFKWVRNRDTDFYSYELWLDTRPDVERISNVTGGSLSETPNNKELVRINTSQLVWRSYGGGATNRVRHHLIEEAGQALVSVTIGELEPDTAYYARLYIQNSNGEWVGSDVVRYVTKTLRAKFQSDALSVYTGAPGDVVTIYLDSEGAPLENPPTHRVLFGGVYVDITYVSDYEGTIVVPNFTQKRLPKDVFIESPNGLLSKARQHFKVV